MRRARVEYAVRGGRLVGTVTLPGRPPQHFEDAAELERCLDRGYGQLVLVDAQHTPAETLDGLATLTDTERAIAKRAAAGASNREIADALYYSVKSVEAYLTRIYRRLGVEGRDGLATVLEADDLELQEAQAELVGGGSSSVVGHGWSPPEPIVVVELLLV